MSGSMMPPDWQRLMQAWPRAGGVAGDAAAAELEEEAGFGPNPGNLRLLALLPDDLPSGAPLVVVLHGCTQTASSYSQNAGWVELAQRHRFALLLPEQRRANNPNVCFNWFEPGDTTRGEGEAASIHAMVGHMVQANGLDRRRVFVTGLSAGGAMAGALLATYPDTFAGGAIVAGLPYGCAASMPEAFDCMHRDRIRPARELGDAVRRASPHRGPWPRVTVWHGGADATVVPGNARETIKQWLDVHGLAGAHAHEDRVDGVPHRIWQDASGQTRVEAYIVPGMDHGVPVAPHAADLRQRCGTAAPFVLDAGISSSWRMAASWGLLRAAADQQSAPHQSAVARPAAPRAAPAGFVAGLRHAVVDPAAVIEKALRAARLLKGG